MTSAHWENPLARALGILLDGRAQPTGIRRLGTEATLFLALNAYHDIVRFTLPRVVGGSLWRCLVDTNRIDGSGSGLLPAGATFEAGGRSLALFELASNTPSQAVACHVSEKAGVAQTPS
jgi:isoamylase